MPQTRIIPEPRIIPARHGFIAVSPTGVRPRIGVSGETEAEARLQFESSFAVWADLLNAVERSESVA
jgi:hypothetical protein